MTLAAGSRLGPYEILAPIGAGGMGEVYKAKDSRLERTVAVKVLPAHLSDSPGVRERFEREARTISQLSHPHICAIYDVGHSGGTDFLVMEYLEGETLAERLMNGSLPPEQTVRYGIEIADALDRAHRTGIVHRDLKPGNVMLTGSGVKLLDFGLAKVFSPGTSQPNLTGLPTQANLTQEGTILGTLQYMAPEQLEAKNADARTDIFAFGALLYEMATGRKAFAGSSQASLIGAILHTEPAPISVLQPMSPPGLDRVVKRCLAKQPERRWQSARDIVLELEEVKEKPGSPATEPVPTKRRFRAAAGWAVAALLLAALLASFFLRGRRDVAAPANRVRFAIAPPADAAYQGMPAISPDGRKLAFVATTADGRDFLYLRPLDSLDARRLEGTDGASYPFWSPDGRSIAFFAQGKLAKIDASGGSPSILCAAPDPRGGSWGSPRDDRLLHQHRWRDSPRGRERRTVGEPSASRRKTAGDQPVADLPSGWRSSSVLRAGRRSEVVRNISGRAQIEGNDASGGGRRRRPVRRTGLSPVSKRRPVDGTAVRPGETGRRWRSVPGRRAGPVERSRDGRPRRLRFGHRSARLPDGRGDHEPAAAVRPRGTRASRDRRARRLLGADAFTGRPPARRATARHGRPFGSHLGG
jgi:predicted Ser/Thr protein kinase